MGPAPVLLIHSGVGAAAEWDRVRTLLDPETRVIAPDLHGFGDAPVPPAPWSHAAQMRDLLDGPAVVCGASFGGLVALQLAALAPDRVERLVLLAPAYDRWEWSEDMESFGAEEERLIEAGDLDAAVELNVRRWAPPGDEELVRAHQRRAFELQLADGAAEPEEIATDVASIRIIPTRILIGGSDRPDFVLLAGHLVQQIPGAELEKHAGAGHLLALERPEAVAHAIKAA